MNYWKDIKRISYSLAVCDFKLRNEGTRLGFVWYLLNPLLLFTLLLLVFNDRLRAGIESYPLYLFLGIILFNLFHKTTIEATNGILHNAGLIKSIKFPGESVIISIVLRNLFEHLFEIIVFAIFLIAFNVSLVGIIFYLIVLVFLILFSYGVSLILSALTIYFIDLKNIWTFISRLLWFATPIFYSIGGQTKLLTFSMFNPLYYFITISRDIIIYQRMPELWMIGGAVIFTVAALAIGIFVFHLLRHKFAEMI